jgi:hypothetical protein
MGWNREKIEREMGGEARNGRWEEDEGKGKDEEIAKTGRNERKCPSFVNSCVRHWFLIRNNQGIGS